MRRIILITSLIIVATPLTPCQTARQRAGQGQASTGAKKSTAAGQQSGSVEQELMRLLDQYEQALLRKDAAALDRLWADDLTFINPSGEVLSKAQRMANLRSGATEFDSVESSERRVRTYGDTAVLTTLVTLKAQYGGREEGGQHRGTLVWVRRGGQWQMVAIQMTPIAPQQNTQPAEKKP